MCRRSTLNPICVGRGTSTCVVLDASGEYLVTYDPRSYLQSPRRHLLIEAQCEVSEADSPQVAHCPPGDCSRFDRQTTSEGPDAAQLGLFVTKCSHIALLLSPKSLTP
uniref:Uncharacterized protein n=1 Tax=Schistocephalus solidus TaxID=70667 RepID=A0A0V0J198_SCHSO